MCVKIFIVLVSIVAFVSGMSLPESEPRELDANQAAFYDLVYRPYHGHGRQWFLYGNRNSRVPYPQGHSNMHRDFVMPRNAEMVENLFKNFMGQDLRRQ